MTIAAIMAGCTFLATSCSADSGESSGAAGGGGAGTAGAGGGSAGTSPMGGTTASAGGMGGAAGAASGGTTLGGSGASAGSSGSGGSGGGGGGGGLGCSRATKLCETFDALAEDALPSGAGWLPRNCFDAGYNIGAKAGALVSSGASTSANSCALVYDMGTQTDFWVSASITITGKAPSTEHEVTFFELGEKADADDPELRIGYRGDSSCSNSGAVYAGFEIGATKGPGGEFTGCTGVVPEPNKAYCLEVHVVQATGMFTAELFSDGKKLDTLVHSKPEPKVQGLFDARYLKVGMQSYSGAFDGLVIDNLSVSSSQVGCGK